MNILPLTQSIWVVNILWRMGCRRNVQQRAISMLLLPIAIASIRAAEDIDIAQVPPAVRQAIAQAGNGSAARRIVVRVVNDRTTYDVYFDAGVAAKTYVRIADDGEILSQAGSTNATDIAFPYPDSVTEVPTMRLNELPAKAQETVRREGAGREIATIHSESMDRENAYAVQFKERGRNPWLYVSADGRVLRPLEKPPPLGLGTTISDTPFAVQQTVRRVVGDGEIMSVQKQTQPDVPVSYKIKVRDRHGTYDIRIGKDGRLLETTRPEDRSPRRG